MATASVPDKMDEQSRIEYESVFSGDERMAQRFLGIKGKLSRRRDTVPIEDIVITKIKKLNRSDTLQGLTAIVHEWGVVTPIHIMTTEDGNAYILLDGLRRIAAALRNGIKQIDAIIWDFEDKSEGKRIAPMLNLMLNRSQKYSNKEIWSMVQMLDKLDNVGPGDIEFVLQLESGEYMKLKDVMTSDSEFEEIQSAYLAGELTIDGAYKKLVTARKKEDRLTKDDKREIALVDGMEAEGSDSPDSRLSVDEVKDMLDMLGDNTYEGQDLGDIDMTEVARDGVRQTTDDRHPLDPALKQSVLIRDKFKCSCCGRGGVHWLSCLVIHHILPVFVGGTDTTENLTTLCESCHLTVHDYAAGKVQLDESAMTEEDKRIFKNIRALGNKIILASKKMGMKRKDFIKADAGNRHSMPGTNIATAKAAYSAAQAQGSVEK